MKTINCTTCGRDGHHQTFCIHKPRKPIETHVQPKRTAIKWDLSNSVTRRAWLGTRTLWLKNNLPDHRGYYQCHYCGEDVDSAAITLDHKIPRSRAPELRHEMSNLVPACYTCNYLKGSVDHDTYKHDCPDGKKEAI
jgi:5-methylcytosine-specific restriction endonuclease McrA